MVNYAADLNSLKLDSWHGNMLQYQPVPIFEPPGNPYKGRPIHSHNSCCISMNTSRKALLHQCKGVPDKAQSPQTPMQPLTNRTPGQGMMCSCWTTATQLQGISTQQGYVQTNKDYIS